MRSLLFFYCFVFLLLKPTVSGKSQNKQSRAPSSQILHSLHHLNAEDRQKIENFFRIFLLKEGGIYVLFGDKPLAITQYFPISAEDMASCFCKKFLCENEQIRKGWQAWKKYSHQFSSRRFLLEGRQYRDRSFEIVLINKELLTRTIKKNLVDFTKHLKTENTALNLLEIYESNDIPLFELLKEHHGLLGILLGFGKRNASLFQLRNEIIQKKEQFALKGMNFSSFSALEKELHDCGNLVPAFPHSKTQCYKMLYLPNFVTDNVSQETKDLRQKYLEQRHAVFQAIDGKNFLEAILQKFCEE